MSLWDSVLHKIFKTFFPLCVKIFPFTQSNGHAYWCIDGKMSNECACEKRVSIFACEYRIGLFSLIRWTTMNFCNSETVWCLPSWFVLNWRSAMQTAHAKHHATLTVNLNSAHITSALVRSSPLERLRVLPKQSYLRPFSAKIIAGGISYAHSKSIAEFCSMFTFKHTNTSKIFGLSRRSSPMECGWGIFLWVAG